MVAILQFGQFDLTFIKVYIALSITQDLGRQRINPYDLGYPIVLPQPLYTVC